MVGVVRGIVVLIALFAVLNAEPFENIPAYDDEVADPDELASSLKTDQEDFVDDLDGVPFQMEGKLLRRLKMTSVRQLLFSL